MKLPEKLFNELIEKLDKFTTVIDEMLETGEVIAEYNIIFEWLKIFTKKHPEYNYEGLTSQQEISLSYFYSDNIDYYNKKFMKEYEKRMKMYVNMR